MIEFNTFLKLTKNVGDLDKLIVAKGFKMLSKVQQIARSVTLIRKARTIDVRYFTDNEKAIPSATPPLWILISDCHLNLLKSTKLIF